MTNEMTELSDRTEAQTEEVVQQQLGGGEPPNRRRFLTKDEVVQLSRLCHDRGLDAIARSTGVSLATLSRAKSEVGRSFSAQVVRQLRAYLGKVSGEWSRPIKPNEEHTARRVGVSAEDRKRPFRERAKGPLVVLHREWVADLRDMAEGSTQRAIAEQAGVEPTLISNVLRGETKRIRQELWDRLSPVVGSWRRPRATSKRQYPKLPKALYSALKKATAGQRGREVAREIGLAPTAVQHMLKTRTLRASTLAKVRTWYEAVGNRSPQVCPTPTWRESPTPKRAARAVGVPTNKVSPDELRSQAAVLRARADGMESLAQSIESLFG